MSNFWRTLVYYLPRDLIYQCAIRVGVQATTGKWGHQEVPALSFMTALKRWEEESNE
jgi:hypothetical protein